MTASSAMFPTIVPTLRYSNVPRAIDWLCDTFGFERHLVVGDEDGDVAYAELTLGNSMIMIGPAEGSAFDRLMKQPGEVGGVETQICYLHVDDILAHRDRAEAAGAEIVLDIAGESRTGRGYSCRDPEGHIWNFGTYDPWSSFEPPGVGTRRRRGALLVTSLLLLAPIAFAIVFGIPEQVSAAMENAGLAWHEQREVARIEPDLEASREIARLRASKEAAERALQEAEERLVFERNAGHIANRALKDAQEELARQRVASVPAAASPDHAVSAQLDRERASRAAAEKEAREAREQLLAARNAKEAAERALLDAQAQLAKAKASRHTAERTVSERVARELREQMEREEAAEEAQRRQARQAAYRAARLAARLRVQRQREDREPSIKPPVPFN